jgi:hypothetical protein
MYRTLADFYNEEPLTGFYSILNFDQCANHSLATTFDPYYKTKVETFSNAGNDFIFLRTYISNNFSLIDDLYPGIFTDWDVGNFALNRGGYDPSRNLFYSYDNGSSDDTSFYGIMGIAIDGITMDPNTMKGLITDSIAWNRIDLFNFMTSTTFDTITTDADYRTFVCVGPFIINAGTTLTVDLAIVAGTSLSDLLVNADLAISYGKLIPLGILDYTTMPIDYLLYQNYPNPFNTTTIIKYSVPQTSNVVIKIYDILGNEIETLVNEEKAMGTYELNWNAENLPSGVYFYQLKAGDFVDTKKMILLK